jgi:hypothetical protein
MAGGTGLEPVTPSSPLRLRRLAPTIVLVVRALSWLGVGRKLTAFYTRPAFPAKIFLNRLIVITLALNFQRKILFGRVCQK